MNRFKLQKERDVEAENTKAFDTLMSDITEFLNSKEKDPVIAYSLVERAKSMTQLLHSSDKEESTVKKLEILRALPEAILDLDQKRLSKLAESLTKEEKIRKECVTVKNITKTLEFKNKLRTGL